MSGLNGHSMNGDGGRGHCSLADLYDPHRARGAASLFAQAIKHGYLDLFAISYVDTRKAVDDMLKSDKPRIKAAGARLAVVMANHDLALMEVIDKSNRLDSDLPTDIVEERVYELEFDDRA